MRQAGMLAAAASHALDHHVARLAQKMPGVDVAYYESHGYSLFHNVAKALDTVAAFAPDMSAALAFMEERREEMERL